MMLTELHKSTNTSPLAPIDEALRKVFANPTEESNVQKARRAMGLALIDVPDEELEVYITKLQYIINEWFDAFERQVFNGKTLKQVLGEV